MSRVDRSYSKYESIRTYEDRGKMKWNPFATAELASAHRDYHKEFTFEEPDFSLEQDEILTMISFAKSLQLEINIEYQVGKNLKNVDGIIVDWTDKTGIILKNVDGIIVDWTDKTGIILKKIDGHYLELEFSSIVKLTDKQYFDSYLKQY